MRTALGMLVVLLTLLAGRAAVSTVERSAFPWPVALPEDRSVGGGAVRLIAVPDGPWTLLVGSSSMHYGVDGAGLPFAHRKQTVGRGLPTDVLAIVDWDLDTLPASARPTRIVVGLNPSSVVDRRRFDRQSPCSTIHVTERLDADLFTAVGCNPEVALSTRWERADRWYARRTMVVRAVGYGLRGWLGFAPEGPRPDARLDRMRGANPAETAARIRNFARNGIATQLPDAVQVRAFELLHAVAAERGVELVGVMMPESSAKRALYSDDARAAFEALAQASFDRVVDLRVALPDEEFYDEAHPNERGRVTLTALLADHLGPPRD